MSYDINVLVIGQESPSEMPNNTRIELINEFEEPLRYKDMWSFMSHSKGIWYCLGIMESEWFNSMSIVDADFDKEQADIQVPYWVEDEDVKSNLKPLIVNDKYKTEFSNIIRFLIKQSPTKTIMFLTRYQGGEKEIICGVISFEEFNLLLNKNEILFNTCYIINEE